MEKKGLAKSIEPFFEKVEKLSKLQRILISSIFFVLIAGFFIYFLYWPKFEKLGVLKKELEAEEKEIKSLEFKFKVEKTWIDENEIEEDTIKLIRYHDGIWQNLSTSLKEN